MFGISIGFGISHPFDDISIEYTRDNERCVRADIRWMSPIKWLTIWRFRVSIPMNIAYFDDGRIIYIYRKIFLLRKASSVQIGTLDSIRQFWIENEAGICNIELVFKDTDEKFLISPGLSVERARAICFALEHARNFRAPRRCRLILPE